MTLRKYTNFIITGEVQIFKNTDTQQSASDTQQ